MTIFRQAREGKRGADVVSPSLPRCPFCPFLKNNYPVLVKDWLIDLAYVCGGEDTFGNGI